LVPAQPALMPNVRVYRSVGLHQATGEFLPATAHTQVNTLEEQITNGLVLPKDAAFLRLLYFLYRDYAQSTLTTAEVRTRRPP
jgi:hypothetical protein